MATSKQPNASGAETETPSALEQIHQHPPLIHLGKVKEKNAKKLKKGKGNTMNEVHMAIQQIQSGLEGSNHHPVVISYEEKPRKGGKKKNKINIMGMKIDRKKLKKRMKKSGIRPGFL
ncbi:MAG: hypothetical protein HUU01_00650 [Saprospiraceae bacterium]|nr:hypothetical protein [Saprospiraceae bacterium]